MGAIPGRVWIEPVGWRRGADRSFGMRLAPPRGAFGFEFLHVPGEAWVRFRELPSGTEEYGTVTTDLPGELVFGARLRKGAAARGPAEVRLVEWEFVGRAPGGVDPDEPREALRALEISTPAELLRWGEPRVSAASPQASALLLSRLSENLRAGEDGLARARSCLSEGRLLEAVVLARRASDLDPGSLEALRTAGLAESRLGLSAEAEATLTRCYLSGARDATVLAERGLSREALGNLPAAAEDLREALGLDPDPALRDEILRALERIR